MVSGCKTALNELRYNGRHDSILANLIKELWFYSKNKLVLYADIADYNSPTIITEPSQRHVIVIADRNKLYVIDLTVGCETRIR